MGIASPLTLACVLFGVITTAHASPLPATAAAPALPAATALPNQHQTGSTLLITQLGSESSVLGVAGPSAPEAGSVPEPASTGLLVLGLAGLACRFRRRRVLAGL